MGRKIEIIRKKEKKVKVNKTLERQKLLWTAGHFVTVTFGILFSITYFYHTVYFYRYRNWKWLFLRVNKHYAYMKGDGWIPWFVKFIPQILYRTSLLGFITASSISISQDWGQVSATWYELLGSENYQSFLLAVIWLIGGRKSFYRLFPFMTISYLHVSARTYEYNDCKEAELEATKKNAGLLQLISYFEFLVAFVLLFDTLMMKDSTAGVSLVCYIGLFWLRLNFSEYAQMTALKLTNMVEEYIPDEYKKQTGYIKGFIHRRIKARTIRERDLSRHPTAQAA